jgi:hypothetical protein
MSAAITVRCKRDAGDIEAPAINDSMITIESIAVARGKRFLDDPSQGGYYQAVRRRFRVPHKGPGIVPGAWVSVSDGRLGMRDTEMKVVSYNLTITPTSVWAEVEADEYVVS